MITGELKSKVDKIWETFWTGGITNPLEVIEQFTYLLLLFSIFNISLFIFLLYICYYYIISRT